jgi:predicted HD phosphohydrolase
MMQDKYRNKFRVATASSRLRQQIALEAARRLLPTLEPGAPDWLEGLTVNAYYVGKRKAAAVLGHRVRPGDLPSDSEVREHLITLARDAEETAHGETGDAIASETEAEPETIKAMADHLDRFAIFKLRLIPLEAVKQNPKYHPEGDALYHSLQVFQLARDLHPHDEEFLLAALLHDVGKAIDPHNHVGAAVEALRGTITERTLWLIEHHMDLMNTKDRPLAAKLRKELESSEFYEDLKQLRELDNAGRVPGEPVETVDEVLAYIRSLEDESYLEG